MATACCALLPSADLGYGLGNLRPLTRCSPFATKLWYIISGFVRRITPDTASAKPFQKVKRDMGSWWMNTGV